MAIGILLGNLLPSTGLALQKGQFVGVSIPIGALTCFSLWTPSTNNKPRYSNRSPCHDVPNPLQSALRIPTPPSPTSRRLDPNRGIHRS